MALDAKTFPPYWLKLTGAVAFISLGVADFILRAVMDNWSSPVWVGPVVLAGAGAIFGSEFIKKVVSDNDDRKARNRGR